MTDHANELRRYSRKIGHPAGDVPSVMLAAADEIERLAARLKAAEKERDALRARIEAMEKQEPAATVRINAINGNPSVDFVPGHHYLHHNDRLYLAPGAQPAPSVPEGWKLVPTAESRHPGIYKMLGASLNMVFNAHMNKDETREIIKAAGGDRAFARLLSLDGTPGYQQRINNWKRRGMPAAVVLDHLPTIQALQSAERHKAA